MQHPYFGEASFARSLIASVRATREAEPTLSDRYAVVGHSEGGHGALDVDVEYAGRLREAGVDCELFVAEDAFHGFDLYYPQTGLARDFRNSGSDALARTGLVASIQNPSRHVAC